MAERVWTDNQRLAFEKRDGTLLVSAAAGSGKTAVLTQRVVERLTDKQKPSKPENLLVVTFTEAAASEMKHRVVSLIDKLNEENQGSSALVKLSIAIHDANIMTMDSFCIRLVRENFTELSVNPDFRICAGSERDLLKNAAIEKTMEELHSLYSESLEELLRMFFKGRDDSLLSEIILKLYEDSCAYPFPFDWLDSLKESFCNEKAAFDSIWGEIIYIKIGDMIHSVKSFLEEAIDETNKYMSEEKEYCLSASALLELDYAQLLQIEEAHKSREYDRLRELSGALTFEKFNTKKCYEHENLKKFVISRRTSAKETIKEIHPLLSMSEAEFYEDIEKLKPVVNELIGAVKIFIKNFDEMKQSENSLDFSDTQHLALKLLYENTDGKPVLTDFARKTAMEYDEILIDEYQDTNDAQNMLFLGISKNGGNLFMVGDVKQSIYSFRNANPAIFIEKSEKLPVFENDNYPAKIILSENFRSSESVIETVNFLFSSLMSKTLGEIEYSGAQQLNYARKKPEGEKYYPETEIKYLTDFGKKDGHLAEAEYIAQTIKESVSRGDIILDINGNRKKVDYSDFCILYRSGKNRIAPCAEILKSHGIPVSLNTGKPFFESREVEIMLSYLRAIDNPLSDIDLLAVMLSPLYGFTPDDIALLRINYKASSIYERLLLSAREDDKKSKELLFNLKRYRLLSSTEGAEDFLRTLNDETKYYAIVRSMPQGEKRAANLTMLIEYARSYDGVSNKGLSGFLRYISALIKTDSSSTKPILGPAAFNKDDNCVKLMTVHGSKGLEFPIVFIADCVHGFSTQDYQGDLLVSQKIGLGMKILELDEMKQYETLSYTALKEQIIADLFSDEMRIFYVAATRAREKLIFMISADNLSTFVNGIYNNLLIENNKITPFSLRQMNSYGKWITAALLREKTSGIALRGLIPANEYLSQSFFTEDKAKINVSVKAFTDIKSEDFAEESPDTEFSLENENKDEEYIAQKEEYLALIKEKIEFNNPYEALYTVKTKYTASGLADVKMSTEYTAKTVPAFLSGSKLSGAETGTATHLFMQLCDFENAAKDIDSELRRLCAGGILTEQAAEAINRENILKFVKSDFIKRVMRSAEVYREKKFAVILTAREIEPGLPEIFSEEKVFVQGECDLVFREGDALVIVDYKTDRVNSLGDLSKMYKNQLITYKKAIENLFVMPVSETLIYSFHLGEMLEIS